MMSNKIWAIALLLLAGYLFITQINANSLVIYGFVAGWVIFLCSKVFRHVSTDEDYRLSTDGVFWIEFLSFTAAIGTTFAVAGKILIA